MNALGGPQSGFLDTPFGREGSEGSKGSEGSEGSEGGGGRLRRQFG